MPRQGASSQHQAGNNCFVSYQIVYLLTVAACVSIIDMSVQALNLAGA